jgi:2Fe-2S ferredoxin
MIAHERNIVFTLIYFGEEIKLAAYDGEFRNLMALINEKIYVEDFGECKGIGRCGTCLVELRGSNALTSPIERNEKSTLGKCAVKMPDLRLSCQVMINAGLHNTIIKIVEDREDVR